MIALRFTCGERKICSTIKKSQNIMNMVVGRGKLLIPPGSMFSKICFPQQEKGVEEIMVCFIRFQSENVKMT